MIVKLTEEQKPAALAALYNASKPQGLGFLHASLADMTVEEAEGLLKEQHYFDYLKGRVMKVDFTTDELDLRLYDRDNGEGAGERALKRVVGLEEHSQ